MTFDDIPWVRDNKDTPLKTRTSDEGDEVEFDYGQIDGNLLIDGNICIPVEATHNSFSENAEIEINDSSGSRIGTLCLTEGYELDLGSISDRFYMSYVTEIPRDLYGEPYRMLKSYVILEGSLYNDYLNKYMRTAPLWGGFVHSLSTGRIGTSYKKAPHDIVAIENLTLPTPYHEESSVRSVVQPYPFERYLKLYHLLELRFDYDIVERIKSLGDDLKGIGQIFSDFGREEVRRLKSVIEPRIKNIDALEARLNGVKHCADCEERAKDIFFRYGKDTNPLKDKESQYDLVMVQGGFSKDLAKSAKLIGGPEAALDAIYRQKLIDVASYWIYRVRSSIAHSRIGEYVMTSSDEEFVVEFAEPLLREVIVQVFSA